MGNNEHGNDKSKYGNYIQCRDPQERGFNCISETNDDTTGFFDKDNRQDGGEEQKDASPSKKELRGRIEPWLTALLQSEHLSLFAGAGLSYAVQETAGINPLCNPMEKITPNDWKYINKHIPNDEDAKSMYSLEVQIRKASILLCAAEMMASSGKKESGKKEWEKFRDEIQQMLTEILTKIKTTVLAGEIGLRKKAQEGEGKSEDEGKRALEYLVRFLMSFASRPGTRERLHIFTTNYDRVIEEGADIAGLRLLDRFVGGLMPMFHSSRLDVDMHYNPPGIRGEPRYVEGVAKFTKLHGSLDWVNDGNRIRRIGMPFGTPDIDQYLKACGFEHNGQEHDVMIYPNSFKDWESTGYPYSDLFRDFAAAICRPNHTLVCYGYSFNDDHINRVIKDMLTISSTHLVVISFDILEKVRKLWCNHSQVTYLMGKHLGEMGELLDNYLPQPAIGRVTQKMLDLTQGRRYVSKGSNHSNSQLPKGNYDIDDI